MNIVARSITAIILFIIGMNFSNSVFFNENPLFGVPFVAETLISFTLALVGFFLVPKAFLNVKEWFETLIIKTFSETAANFWEQYARKVQESRKQRNSAKKAQDKAKEKEKKLKDKLSNGILIDTSVLIDGRILDIAKTGFLSSKIVVPNFVLDELRLVSDSKDKLKRQRGRRGLDILKSLKKQVKVVIFDGFENDKKKVDVDKELVNIAKKYKSNLMTLDFNLSKVADVSGVKVLNINDLANAVKSVVLPGEELEVKVIQEGKEDNQGVAYLPDGTMIVIEAAKDLVGKSQSVVVSKVIQKAAGKMIFAKLQK